MQFLHIFNMSCLDVLSTAEKLPCAWFNYKAEQIPPLDLCVKSHKVENVGYQVVSERG